ncbi:rCG35770 [Rattus norvegicus]|uniref:RCG35770 n=1 Tax=Rattus norvegicus TaxID=10116 RepID=A6IJP0_RAT|nr:rCG35770 [Rattus norvegicus]
MSELRDNTEKGLTQE